jgi:hypothetical protein
LEAACASARKAAAANDRCLEGRVEGVAVEGGTPEPDSGLGHQDVSKITQLKTTESSQLKNSKTTHLKTIEKSKSTKLKIAQNSKTTQLKTVENSVAEHERLQKGIKTLTSRPRVENASRL